MPGILIEAAIESADCAKAAAIADRLEVCSALDLGGLTPTVGLVAEVKAASALPLCLMVRPRPGDFVYSEAEFKVMAWDMEALIQFRPAAFVFGILTSKGYIDEQRCKTLLDIANGIPCVFHRAFDRTRSLNHSLEALIGLGFKRVLTSGRANTATEGIANLVSLAASAMGRIEILPCGGIRSSNVKDIIQATALRQIHASFAEDVPLEDARALRGYSARKRLSTEELAATRAVVDVLR